MKISALSIFVGAAISSVVSADYSVVPTKACNAPVSTFTAGTPHGAISLTQVSTSDGDLWTGQLNIRVDNSEGYTIQQVGVNQANPNVNLCNSIAECAAINWADYTVPVTFTPINAGSVYKTPRLTVFFYFNNGPISSASYIMSCEDGTSPDFEWSATAVSLTSSSKTKKTSSTKSSTSSTAASTSSDASTTSSDVSTTASASASDASLSLQNKAASSTASESSAAATSTGKSSGASALAFNVFTCVTSMLAIVVAVGAF